MKLASLKNLTLAEVDRFIRAGKSAAWLIALSKSREDLVEVQETRKSADQGEQIQALEM